MVAGVGGGRTQQGQTDPQPLDEDVRAEQSRSEEDGQSIGKDVLDGVTVDGSDGWKGRLVGQREGD